MTRIAALMIAALVAFTPAAAQQADEGADMREGLDLLGEGMRLLFKGLGDEIEPQLKDLADRMQPAMTRLMELIDDIDAYHPPEKLPNGDIILRRKTPDEEVAPPADPQAEIEI
ncbi:hypothetical protein EV663_10225 [Rhodovulum bhavnagarense]|uniref:AAA+ family ATPase n=1 Tax=Rhodovulum bhavnagarense TaxID=992286 RepID=A0A4R2RF46_9RHOB|nr:hypothetical protein [Rhodovulum bhavnagarense]TCP62182.1 hypothetical protein EV663_10225 [Rhodovulum bhavnagarense]